MHLNKKNDKPLCGGALDGTFDPRFIVSHYVRLDEGPEAYKMMYNHDDHFIKCLLRPDLPAALKPAGAP